MGHETSEVTKMHWNDRNTPQWVEKHKNPKNIIQWIRNTKILPSGLEIPKETPLWVKTIKKLPSESWKEEFSSKSKSSRTSPRSSLVSQELPRKVPREQNYKHNSPVSHKKKNFPQWIRIIKHFPVSQKLPRIIPSKLYIIRDFLAKST